jgi:hypothetical protein
MGGCIVPSWKRHNVHVFACSYGVLLRAGVFLRGQIRKRNPPPFPFPSGGAVGRGGVKMTEAHSD